ncbi:MAG: amidohydrolase family protein [Paracoccaceae bacterium]
MADIRITNCHIHTFTQAHVPRRFPSVWLWPFRKVPLLIRFLAFLCRLPGWMGWADALDRLWRFQQEAGAKTQEQILNRLVPQYPQATRFVVLPLDMTMTGHGPVRAGLREQHDELAALVRKYPAKLIPFATCDPRAPGAAAEVRRCITELGFRGLKLYPRTGFSPDHPVLMEQVYPLLAERNLPVVSHCSRGGLRGRGISADQGDWLSRPTAFLPVMERFGALRINLAHFGGQTDWRAYAEGVADEDRNQNWLIELREMIRSGLWPGLWTDISYTLFHFEDFAPFLRIFLEDPALARRVLFGSDFYMTRQEALSERAVSFRLRMVLGETLFRQIAEANPAIWLGEVPDPGLP